MTSKKPLRLVLKDLALEGYQESYRYNLMQNVVLVGLAHPSNAEKILLYLESGYKIFTESEVAQFQPIPRRRVRVPASAS